MGRHFTSSDPFAFPGTSDIEKTTKAKSSKSRKKKRASSLRKFATRQRKLGGSKRREDDLELKVTFREGKRVNSGSSRPSTSSLKGKRSRSYREYQTPLASTASSQSNGRPLPPIREKKQSKSSFSDLDSEQEAHIASTPAGPKDSQRTVRFAESPQVPSPPIKKRPLSIFQSQPTPVNLHFSEKSPWSTKTPLGSPTSEGKTDFDSPADCIEPKVRSKRVETKRIYFIFYHQELSFFSPTINVDEAHNLSSIVSRIRSRFGFVCRFCLS